MVVQRSLVSLVLFSLLFSLFRFWATRWVEDRPVAERAIEVWGPCVKLIRHYESLSKSKRPKNKSYERLVSHYTDLLVPVKLQFFIFVVTIFQPYPSFFQTDAPMIPFTCTKLENIYNKFLSLVLRQSCLKKTTFIANSLKKDWIKNKQNHLENGLLYIVKNQMSSQNHKRNSKVIVRSLWSMSYSRSMKDHPCNSALPRMHNH